MNNLIKKIVDIATLKKEGHIPSSLSILDIMYVLYNKVLDIDSIKENIFLNSILGRIRQNTKLKALVHTC